MMLKVLEVSEAETLVRSLSPRLTREETVPLALLPGRVSAADVLCPEDVPAFPRSTMDGWAVIAENVFGAGDASPVWLDPVGEVKMGKPADFSLADGECAAIPTGGMLPANATGVVPVEYTERDPEAVLVYKGVSPYENVVRVGDDVKKGAVLLPAFTRLSPSHVGVLAAAGITETRVLARPKVGVISTGNELLPPGAPLPPGRVRDVNSSLLEAWLRVNGCEPVSYGIVPDEASPFTAALKRAADENDLVLVSGGSSAGEADLTARVLSDLGTVRAHGLAMKPGKPTVIGNIGAVPVFGLPGHPAACYFVAEALVRVCIEALSGAALPRRRVAAVLSENVGSNHGREEFLCVRLENANAVPVYGKSGVLSQLSCSSGYVRIPRDAEGYTKGTAVTVTLF